MHTEPALTQKWQLGPEGGTMPVYIDEARPGGNIRQEWRDGKDGGLRRFSCRRGRNGSHEQAA